MNEALISACGSVIVGLLALAGVIATGRRSNREVQSKIETAQAVTDTKLSELTREVREHNNFARRVPVMEEQIKVINKRISNTEINLQRRDMQ